VTKSLHKEQKRAARLGYTIPEVAESLAISVRKVNELIATGKLESFKVDKCRRITPEAVAKLIHRGEAA
jgi:excisionase family DNA binding protein